MHLSFEQEIRGVTHPHVAAMYVKRAMTNDSDKSAVLVIESHATAEAEDLEMNGKDEYLLEILSDLETLKAVAEAQAGLFSHVDIRLH